MIPQHHHPKMPLYTVGLKSVLFLGNADLTAWYVMSILDFFLLYHFLQHLTFEKTYLRHFILSPISLDNSCS